MWNPFNLNKNKPLNDGVKDIVDVKQVPLPPKKSLDEITTEYKERRKQQMLRFMATSVFTLVIARYTYTSIQARKYVPKLFEGNQKIPISAYKTESMSALGLGTGLALGSFGMMVTGTCWCGDILNAQEFSYKIRRLLLGEEGAKKLEKKHAQMMSLEDDDYKELQEAISGDE
ncbi:hypothetical protein FOG50_01068 [Hanseniaspora uvarum]|nr:hypothetical protein FOG48_02259 [Hanseniaspora uvarum]KAF0278081.1 hypothetical protein FOG50_01068 [Hanseniaspora uvarum]